MATPLGCPTCLRSDKIETVEEMTVHFEITELVLDDDGDVSYEYTGEHRDFVETADHTGLFHCGHCDKDLRQSELVPISPAARRLLSSADCRSE